MAVCVGLRFYLGYTFLSFFCQLPSDTERNSTKTCHVFGSESDFKTYVKNLRHPLPLKIMGPKPPDFDIFRRYCNLTANVTANIFGMIHNMDNL